MQFNHYGGEAARLAADLVNAPAPLDPDALEPLLRSHRVTRTRLSLVQARSLWDWSRRLAPCFGDQPLEGRCQAINDLLASASTSPYISTHDRHAPHLHYNAPDADPAGVIRAVTAAGLAYVVCFAGPRRLGRCARPTCGLAFVDTSRNGRRAYCTVRCANNDAVARHRARSTARVPSGSGQRSFPQPRE